MTIADHHPTPSPEPPITSELFERLADIAHNEEGVTLEHINRKVWVHKVTDGAHGGILMWLLRQFMAYRSDLDLNITGQGLKIDPYRKGRARPDGALAPVGHFDQSGEWADLDGVLAVVEMTSWDADTHARDRVEKPVAYADSGISAYLLVDREADAVVVHSRPVDGRYLDRSEHPYGEAVEIPGTGVVLDTDELKRFAR